MVAVCEYGELEFLWGFMDFEFLVMVETSRLWGVDFVKSRQIDWMRGQTRLTVDLPTFGEMRLGHAGGWSGDGGDGD